MFFCLSGPPQRQEDPWGGRAPFLWGVCGRSTGCLWAEGRERAVQESQSRGDKRCIMVSYCWLLTYYFDFKDTQSYWNYIWYLFYECKCKREYLTCKCYNFQDFYICLYKCFTCKNTQKWHDGDIKLMHHGTSSQQR